MSIRVVTSQDAWNGFLRRAKKAFPKEYMEVIWGVETVDSYRITDFKKIHTAKQTQRGLEYDDVTLEKLKWQAAQEGKEFLGTVHTHPRAEFDTSPSQEDHTHAVSGGEKVMGVVVIYKKNNRFVVETDWWFPQRKIEFILLPED